MREFTVYVELNGKGKISDSAYLRLKEYCDLVSNISLNLVWIFQGKISFSSIRRIIRFERKFCTYKKLVVHNILLAKTTGTSLPARFLINKYNFKFSVERSEEFEKDCVRICFGNKPESCRFNSCLGKNVYIKADGIPKVCPFADNSIALSEEKGLQNIYEIFNTESFASLITDSIQRRSLCKANCEYFSLCKGYCPLDTDNNLPKRCSVKEAITARKEFYGKQKMTNETFKEQVIEQIAEKYKL